MFVQRTLACLACAAASSLPAAAEAQGLDSGSRAGSSSSIIGAWPSRSYLGLNLGRTRNELSCEMPGLGCDMRSAATHLYGGYMLNRHMALEVGYLDFDRLQRELGPTRAQGLHLSLVGRAQIGEALGVFGHLGTTYSRSDTSALGAAAAPGAESGFGLSYGAGVSWAFSPRGSATLGWDSQELRLPGMGRDTLRTTRLGLQWRY
jgi:hypothetical protein